MEIIPAIDLIDGKSVRLQQGDYDKQVVMPMSAAEAVTYYSQFPQVTRIHVVDLIGATRQAAVEGETIEILKTLTDIPLEIGGGIRNLETLELYDKLGIDYFILGTRAIMDVPWLKAVVSRYPGRIYLGLDCKDDEIYVNGWKEASGRYIQEYLDEIANFDLAGIIYTDIFKDGMEAGPNVEKTGQIQRMTKHRVVASGGVRNRDDLDALEAEGVSQAIVGKAAQNPSFWEGL
ncbi:HisA/HisF-related TIM barrel protein [Aerococcaceae bacterium 50-4]